MTLPLLLEPEQLNQHLTGNNLLIIDLCAEQQYQQAHIPGAVHVSPKEIVIGQPPAPGRLPEQARLDALFSRLGLTPDTHIICYDDEGGGWAGRFIWTLDVIGHRNYSYLNGGIHSWRAEGLETEAAVNEAQPKPVTVTVDRTQVVEAEQIMDSLDNPDFAIWDARSPGEHNGSKVLAQRGGHIPGAINCEWTALMDPSRGLRIRNDAADILQQLGLTPDKDIVTHCQTHHRSGFTYLVAKVLGYPRIRGYHGSWSEWGNRDDTPVEVSLLPANTNDSANQQDVSGELFVALQRLLPQHTLSRLIARLAEAKTPWLKRWLIERFISAYKINMAEALEQNLESYENFNAFFTRQLSPDARPLDTSTDSIVSPVDGTINQIGELDGNQLIQAKGKTFSAEALLGNEQDASYFLDGHFTTIYLSPSNYHRVHMPIDGTLLHCRYIPGKLFSVNGTTARHIPELFARNERLVCLFESPVGKVAVILVGAMLVAGIGTVWQPSYPANSGAIEEQYFADEQAPILDKGAELGHFNFGSMVILLFEKEAMQWSQQFDSESVVQMGKHLATAQHTL